jgi:hypothetical protein
MARHDGLDLVPVGIHQIPQWPQDDVRHATQPTTDSPPHEGWRTAQASRAELRHRSKDEEVTWHPKTS